MFVGVLRLTFHIPGSRSLKDRRRVVRSFKDRVTSRLRASVAEVGALEQLQKAIVAVAVVSNDATRVDELLSSAASLADNVRDAVLVDRALEIIPFGTEGTSVGMTEPGSLGGQLQSTEWGERSDDG